MTDAEIIQAAFNKATQNGYTGKLPTIETKDGRHYLCTSELLFDIEFAKALWGDEYDYRLWSMAWQYHLQEMVISKDPLKYLEANL